MVPGAPGVEDVLNRKHEENREAGSQHPEQVPMAGGLAASSRIPPLHLIPTVALERLADRFQLGIERKGDKAWNALSANQAILTNREFAIERLGHIIHHAMKLRDKLQAGFPPLAGDDDAAAIAWGGVFLICVTQEIENELALERVR